MNGCGACDEQGHPVDCRQCIWAESCLDSTETEQGD